MKHCPRWYAGVLLALLGLGGCGSVAIQVEAVNASESQEVKIVATYRAGRVLYKRSNQLLAPWRSELKELDIRIGNDVAIDISWSESARQHTGRNVPEVFYFDDVLYLNYDYEPAQKRRDSYVRSVTLDMEERPRKIRVRPLRRSLSPMLLDAVDRYLFEDGKPPAGALPLKPEDHHWAGWRRIRPAEGGLKSFEYEPSGARLLGAKHKGPGTLRLRVGRTVRIPIRLTSFPLSRDEDEEKVEAIIIPESIWYGRMALSSYWDGSVRRPASAEAVFIVPPEMWKRLVAAELKDAGLVMGRAQGEKDCGPTSDKQPVVCLTLEASTALPEPRLLVMSAYHPNDTAFSLVAYRLEVVP